MKRGDKQGTERILAAAEGGRGRRAKRSGNAKRKKVGKNKAGGRKNRGKWDKARMGDEERSRQEHRQMEYDFTYIPGHLDSRHEFVSSFCFCLQLKRKT